MPDDRRLHLVFRVDRALAFLQGTVDPPAEQRAIRLSDIGRDGPFLVDPPGHQCPAAVDVPDPRFFDRAGVRTVGRFLPRFGRLQQPTPPVEYPKAPEAFSVSGREAFEIAAEEPEVAELTAKLGQLSTREEVRDDGRWQVGFFSKDDEVVQVHVDGGSGDVVETWRVEPDLIAR